MARKSITGTTDNAAFSQFDKTPLFFVQNCGACHPGGGPAEFDRDNRPYARFVAPGQRWGRFGNDPTGLATSVSYYVTHGDNASGVSGDYAFVNPASPSLAAARWDNTGVLEADCLMCHMTGYNWTWRTATLGAGAGLMAASGLPAFATAPTAGAGWATPLYAAGAPGKQPAATSATIAYPLSVDSGGWLANIVKAVPDANCRGCHSTPDMRKSGRSWESDTDAHKARAVSCVYCHPAGSSAADARINGAQSHEIAKGNITVGSVRDDIDNSMYGCRECHVDRRDARAPNPANAHRNFPSVHFSKLSCNVCHIPYLEDSALTATKELPDLVIDYTVDGNGIIFQSNRFLSNNPVDPKTVLPGVSQYRWYPAVMPHAGVIKTVKPLVTVWWGLWNGQEGAASVVKPVILRNLRKAIGFASNTTGVAPSGKSLVYSQNNSAGTPYYFFINTALFSQLSDANGDNVVDVNTPAEIVAFIDAIGAQNDHFGQPIVPPGWQLVLAKAGRVYYKTGAAAVDSFASASAESPPFAINHNVRPSYQALGAGGCQECHAPGSPFFFRKELKDPYGLDNASVYEEAWETMGYTAAQVEALTSGVPEPGAVSAGSSECFIATAAFGSPYEAHVTTLRSFRERYLLGNPLGRLFVRGYYALSPPVARFIAGHEGLKAAVRIGLLPFVGFATVMVEGSAAAKAGLLAGLGVLWLAGLFLLRRLCGRTA